jgi:hypothetical protein
MPQERSFGPGCAVALLGGTLIAGLIVGGAFVWALMT